MVEVLLLAAAAAVVAVVLIRLIPHLVYVRVRMLLAL